MKKNILLLLVALAVSFGLAEMLCRIKGSYLSYNERTGASGYTSPFQAAENSTTRAYLPYQKRSLNRNEFKDEWTANEDGLKDKNILPNKTGKRILVLGDSFAEGVGAPPDSSYPRLLQMLLPDTVQVINAGIAGSDIFFEYKLLQTLLPKYKPDVVLVTCNPSDIIEHLTRGGFERYKADGTVHFKTGPWFEGLYAHSLLVRVLVHDVLHYDFNFIKRQNFEREQQKALADMCAGIDSFQTFCGQNHLQLAILFHPFYPDVQYPEFYTLPTLINHCRQNHIVCTDELPYLQAHGINGTNWQTIYWPADGHFKPAGYQLLAECAYQLLEKN